MESGLNDVRLGRRLLFGLLPAALSLLVLLAVSAVEGVSAERWAITGGSGFIALLVALSAPSAYPRIGALRWVVWSLCWLPLSIDQFGLILSLVLSPLVMGAVLASGSALSGEETQ